MRISANSWIYAGFPTWLPNRPLDAVIDQLGQSGFDGIEIGAAAPHGFPDYLSSERRTEVRERVKRAGMSVSAICPALGGGPGYNPASPDTAERQAGARYIEQCIRLAADLGAGHVIWLAGYRCYGQSRREAWELSIEGLAAAGKVAADTGVALAVEPTAQDSNLVESAADARCALDEADIALEVAGVMLDTAHVWHRQDDVRDALAEAGDRLVYVHLAEENRDPPGDHHSFQTVIEQLRQMGYDGWLTMEVGFNRRERDPDALLRRGLAHLREQLDATRCPSTGSAATCC